MSVRFDTSTDRLLRTADLLDFNSPYTIAAWVHIVTDLNALSTFWALSDGSANNADRVMTNTDGTQLQARVFAGGSGASVNGSQLSVGAWTHLACVRESATAFKVYINATLDVTNTTDVTGRTTASRMEHGAFRTANVNPYDGRVASIKAWSTNLTADEIARERLTVYPQRLANLYGFWPCALGARLKDWSGQGRDWTEGGALTDEDDPPGLFFGQRLFVVPGMASSTSVSTSDSATLAETSSLSASDTRTDGLSLSEQFVVSVTSAASDSAALAEASQLDLAASDSATLAETAGLAATAATSDSASFGETSRIDLAATDTAALADSASLSVSESAADSATLAEAASVALAATDSASAADSASLSATASATDSSTLADSSALAAALEASDSGTLADASSLDAGGTLVTVADSAVLADASSLAAASATSETAALAETSSIALSAADVITFAESAVVTVQVAATDAAALSETRALTALFAATDTHILTESASVGSGAEATVFLDGTVRGPARSGTLRSPARDGTIRGPGRDGTVRGL